MKKRIVIILLCLLFAGCEKSVVSRQDVSSGEIRTVSLIAVGDNLIHDSVYKSAARGEGYDFRPIFAGVAPVIAGHDLKFVNQETILGGVEIGLSSYPRFNSPFEVGDALVELGFNLISVANNHTLDRGEIGVFNAVNYWQAQPVVYAGAEKDAAAETVKRFLVNGVRFAFIAYTYGTNGIPHPGEKSHLANVYADEKARVDIEGVRAAVDVVIVSMHWGEEYQDYPNAEQKRQAAYLSDLGADIIIGHHPHVIQPVDLIKNKSGRETFVIYSLGNFLSGQVGTNRLIGMAVSLVIELDGAELKLVDPKARLLFHYRDHGAYRVIPYSEIPEGFLSDYDYYFARKKKLIRHYYENIAVY